MTANVNIKRGDLHLAVSTAFNRGRYVLMTGGGDGQPIEITIDLRERPDDMFGSEFADVEDDGMVPDRIRTEGGVWVHVQRPADAPPCTDDHGPAIPAQSVRQNPQPPTGPRVYEFALQDADLWPSIGLERVVLSDAPDQSAAESADWVHVYDRVTRERRTLKRPEPDAVLTGLRDVAADLRGKAYPEKAADHLRALERGAPVEPPFGCAALPPVGPLTSTEGLRAGDVVRAEHSEVFSDGDGLAKGDLHTVDALAGDDVKVRGGCTYWRSRRFAFVGRPDADGWMTGAGGENPVPGANVEIRLRNDPNVIGRSDPFRWTHDDSNGNPGADIVAFRIVDTPPAV